MVVPVPAAPMEKLICRASWQLRPVASRIMLNLRSCSRGLARPAISRSWSWQRRLLRRCPPKMAAVQVVASVAYQGSRVQCARSVCSLLVLTFCLAREPTRCGLYSASDDRSAWRPVETKRLPGRQSRGLFLHQAMLWLPR